ncbi:DNA polymerase epsilon catalytic subunit A, partial [Smittium culicis]
MKRQFGRAYESTGSNYSSELKTNNFYLNAANGNIDEKYDIFNDLDQEADNIDSFDINDSADRINKMDEKMGFVQFQAGSPKIGWMVNMHPTTINDPKTGKKKSAVDYYFLDEEGSKFKSTMIFKPYIIVAIKDGTESEVEEYLKRKFEGVIVDAQIIDKEDLDMANHLTGKRRICIKLLFNNIQELMSVRKTLQFAVKKNKEKLKIQSYNSFNSSKYSSNIEEYIVELREHDVPYYQRVAIDQNIRVGLWYLVTPDSESITLKCLEEKVNRPDPVVLAYDIETTKLPLKFPDASIDMIMMISYMIDTQGFLITNRAIVSEDIEDFEYTPKEEFPGPFTIFNEPDEKSLIIRFFDHIRESLPTVLVTYNGDSFDWPFLHNRAEFHGLNLFNEIGWYKDSAGEYKSRYCNHMDCFKWVKRDSYLPVGSQGLKAVTTAKLGYNPMELDPEDMTIFASEKPQTLAQYSVSDAVATYYLYMKYVHPFIFSLCNIIPFNGDDVLRKGSGTLCEALLMVEAYKAEILIPNKYVDPLSQSYSGHLLENETYVGGHVEALEAGVFRSDIPMLFNLDPSGFQELIDDLDNALKFSITVEGNLSLDEVENYQEIKDQISEMLTKFKNNPICNATPLIYHLDVAAMYPNIILTNRLQPDSIVDESVCASCDFNLPGKTCDRKLTWLWRGEYYPATKGEINMLKSQMNSESATASDDIKDTEQKPFYTLNENRQAELLKKRVREYSRKVYNKIREIKVEERTSTICQRENPFYVDTVRNFRDRRYVYKELLKSEKQKHDSIAKSGDPVDIYESKKLMVTYDSLQLAHKCILNSFYGYVMRRGARWRSLEMAGVVCLTGSKIIQLARRLVEKVGRPLELDTDGIWCTLPNGFPENFAFKVKNGKKPFRISYPCSMLNHLVHDNFTNHQYQDRDPESNKINTFVTRSENSIFFEIDGPYRAMVLPSSTQADKLLKKRYAVFNADGSLAELKGFEVKRRGELKLIKIFQSEIFSAFLKGSSLSESYGSVAEVADRWLDLLYSKGKKLSDFELFDLLTENRNMSKTLESYGSQKSTAICTARRLAEFLGDQMVKDAGLACKLIISNKPAGAPVSERAIPVVIFQAEPEVKAMFLRRWLSDSSMTNFDIRDILDWNYYLERFGSVIQKIITIPAAMQSITNPVPRIKHPDWLTSRVNNKAIEHRQMKLTGTFEKKKGSLYYQENDTKKRTSDQVLDMEEIGNNGDTGAPRVGICRKRKANSGADDSRDIIVFTPKLQLTPALKMMISRNPQEAVSLLESKIELLGKIPDPSEDYGKYLEVSTSKWRYQRFIRKIIMQNIDKFPYDILNKKSNKSNSTPATGNLGINQFFEQTKYNLTRNPWYVLQIAKTATPGIVKLWILVSNQIQSINVSVPRIFYVMSSTPNSKLEQSKIFSIAPKNLVLPRKFSNGSDISNLVKSGSVNNSQYYLYQCKVSEVEYLENESTWESFFAHPDIAGVFETKISPLERAIMQLGSVISINHSPSVVEKLNNPNLESIDLFELVSMRGPESNPELAPKFKAHFDFSVDKAAHKKPFSLLTAPKFSDFVKKNTDFIFIYYSVLPGSNRNSRALISVAFPNSSKGNVYAVDSDKQNAIQQTKNINKYYADGLVGIDDSSSAFPYSEELSFEVTITSSIQKVYIHLQSILSKYLSNNNNKPTVIAHYSISPFTDLAKNVRILDEFPVIELSVNEQDKTSGLATINGIPNFNWHLSSSKTMVSRFLSAGLYINERMFMSEYSDIPMSNIPSDDPSMFLSDINFARQLISNRHILWWSPSKLPDLGGREEDESGVFVLDSGNFNNDGANDTGEKNNFRMENGLYLNVPGSHHSMCVEIELHNLAVNAVLQSSHILDLDGSGADPDVFDLEDKPEKGNSLKVGSEPKSKENGDNNDMEVIFGNPSILSSNQISSATFQVLRNFLKTCYKFGDIIITETNTITDKATKVGYVNNEKKYGDFLIKDFYRWITKPNSRLYDPVLVSTVSSLMRKNFVFLQHEISRLGAKSIFSSSNKIVLVTKKKNIEASVTFITYLTESIQKQLPFERLALIPKMFWKQLIWLDEVNFGGISVLVPDSNKDLSTTENSQMSKSKGDTEQGGIVDIEDDSNERIEMLWSIKDSLPIAMHEHFEVIVAEFIYECYQYHDMRNKSEDSDYFGTANGKNSSGQSQNGLDDNNSTDYNVELMKLDPKDFYFQLIGRKYSRRSLQLIPQIESLISGENKNDP